MTGAGDITSWRFFFWPSHQTEAKYAPLRTFLLGRARAPSRDTQLYYWRPLEMAVVTSLEWDDDVDDGCIFYFAGWSLSRHARAPPWAAGTRGWAQGHSVSALSFCPVCGPCLFPYSVLKYCPENEKQEVLRSCASNQCLRILLTCFRLWMSVPPTTPLFVEVTLVLDTWDHIKGLVMHRSSNCCFWHVIISNITITHDVLPHETHGCPEQPFASQPTQYIILPADSMQCGTNFKTAVHSTWDKPLRPTLSSVP